MIAAVEKAMYELNYGKTCVKCNTERVSHKLIVSVDKGGKALWRNLYAVCYSHENSITEEDLIKLDKEREDEYGISYYMDANDLYGMGLINKPSNLELDKYFKRQQKRFGK